MRYIITVEEIPEEEPPASRPVVRMFILLILVLFGVFLRGG